MVEAAEDAREHELASKKQQLELEQTTIALERIHDEHLPARFAHERRLAWAKLVSAPLMVVVAAVTAYYGVNRHAQIEADEQLALKKFELETTLRYSVIKDYLALPNETSRSRLDMLSFIEQTDERPEIKAWARARREELQKAVDQIGKDDQRLRDQLGGLGIQPEKPTDWTLHCSTTVPATANTQQRSASMSIPSGTPFTEEVAKARCQAFAENACKEVGLDASKCQPHFEIVPPRAPPAPAP